MMMFHFSRNKYIFSASPRARRAFRGLFPCVPDRPFPRLRGWLAPVVGRCAPFHPLADRATSAPPLVVCCLDAPIFPGSARPFFGGNHERR